MVGTRKQSAAKILASAGKILATGMMVRPVIILVACSAVALRRIHRNTWWWRQTRACPRFQAPSWTASQVSSTERDRVRVKWATPLLDFNLFSASGHLRSQLLECSEHAPGSKPVDRLLNLEQQQAQNNCHIWILELNIVQQWALHNQSGFVAVQPGWDRCPFYFKMKFNHKLAKKNNFFELPDLRCRIILGVPLNKTERVGTPVSEWTSWYYRGSYVITVWSTVLTAFSLRWSASQWKHDVHKSLRIFVAGSWRAREGVDNNVLFFKILSDISGFIRYVILVLNGSAR